MNAKQQTRARDGGRRLVVDREGPMFPRRGRSPAQFRSAFLLTFLGIVGAASAPVARAQLQQDRTVPRADYYVSLQGYYDGDYRSAAKAFRQAARSGVRSSVGRWVDSICYHTMMGECYYQMGELPLALEQYDAALTLYLAHENWMLRIQFPTNVRPQANARLRGIEWGPSKRNVAMGDVPDVMMSRQGTDLNQVLQQGGALVTPNLYPVNVKEVVRCTALALRRRAELMGPCCPHSALTGRLVAAFSRKPVPPNHWSASWANLCAGLAYASAGRDAEAVSELHNSLLLAGRFDHHLTSTAMLELGRLSQREGKYDQAEELFREASLTAAAFEQFDVVAEAMRGGYTNFRLAGKPGIYPPLGPAAGWAHANSRALEAALTVLTAENLASIGQADEARAMALQALRTMARREMADGKLGARRQYVWALVNYQNGNVKDGDGAFRTVLGFQNKGSLWLFQTGLADSLYVSDAVTDRVSMALFDELLREPLPSDWATSPMETLSYVAIPHLLPMEHWFDVAMKRKEFDRALEISDRVRRHRFHATLPMGGRLLSLRWVLEAPTESLSKEAVLQRQDLLLKYPRYAELSREAQAVRDQLRRLPVVLNADQLEHKKLWDGLYEQLGRLSGIQEVMLREMALSHHASEFVFPPVRSFKELQARTRPGEIVLSFFSAGHRLYAFAYAQGSYTNWEVEGVASLNRQIAELLKQIGNTEGNLPIRSDELEDPQWKEMSEVIFGRLNRQIRPDAWKTFDELVIVPEGPLWYLPFQAMQVREDVRTVPLITKTKIRFAPTVALAHPDDRGRLAESRTTVAWGEMFPGTDKAFAEAALKRLTDALPGSVLLPDQPRVPSSLAKTGWDRLLVIRDMTPKSRDPYDWAPLHVDRGKPGASLADWMQLPWGGPREVVLPGFHSAAEDSNRHNATGDELFLTVCGMMATGTRTMLISRWRVGGQTGQDIVREFVQELPHTSAADAWQRGVEVVSNNRLMPAGEPRLKLAADRNERELDASHPFFWSGYMLIDTGSRPN